MAERNGGDRLDRMENIVEGMLTFCSNTPRRIYCGRRYYFKMRRSKPKSR